MRDTCKKLLLTNGAPELVGFSANGKLREADERCKEGVITSPGEVRSKWLRHVRDLQESA